MPETWDKFYETVTVKRLFNVLRDYQEFIRVVEKCAGKGPVLEIGPGTGAASLFLAALGIPVFCLDNDPVILSKLAERARVFSTDLKLIHGDMRRLPFREKQFTVCFHQGVMEHFDIGTIQQAIADQLKAADTLVFSVPTDQYPRQDFGNENLWSVTKWWGIMEPFHVLETLGFDYNEGAVRRLRRYERLPFRCIPRRLWPSAKITEARQVTFVVKAKSDSAQTSSGDRG